MSGAILIYGYPQGEWEPLLRVCAEDPPDAIIILGDCHLRVPLRQQIKSVFDAGIRVMWIPGNHDADTEARYDFLWTNHPEGNLHTTRCRIGSIRIGGLGGVAKGRLCYPLVGSTEPMRTSRRHHLRLLSPEERCATDCPCRCVTRSMLRTFRPSAECGWTCWFPTRPGAITNTASLAWTKRRVNPVPV
jgi:hypothetical protein